MWNVQQNDKEIGKYKYIHTLQKYVYTEKLKKYIENDLGNEISHIFPLKFFFYNRSLKKNMTAFLYLIHWVLQVLPNHNEKEK